MAKEYNWRTSSRIISGGYDQEGVGVIQPILGGELPVLHLALLAPSITTMTQT